MKHEIKQQLQQKAAEMAQVFSNPNREYNTHNETYRVDKITPCSEYSATITFLKSSGRYALMCAFYIKNDWFTFFPTDSHLEGMRHMPDMKQRIEQANFEVSPPVMENRPYVPHREFD